MRKSHLLSVFVLILLGINNLSAQNNYVKVLTLEEMFRLALKNSKQLKLSNIGVNVAKKATDLMENLKLPSVEISLSASYLGDAIITDRNFTNSITASMPHLGNNFSLKASQVIFAGGSIDNSIEKAELEEKIAQLNFDKQAIDLRFLLTGYYLDLYKLINLRKVYIKNIEQTNIVINQIKSKQEEGMALNNDVTRHELMLKNIELTLIEIDNNCKIINNQLVTTLGLPDSTIIKPDSTILDFELENTTQSELLEAANRNIPELKSAKVNLEVAEKNIKIAQAEYLPSIELVAANYLDGPITIEVPPINKNLNYWYFGIGLKYNLSSLFTTSKVVNKAKIQQNIAIDAKSIIEEQSELAIKSTFIKYKESYKRLHTLEKSLQLANENYDVINYRYLNNLVLITEMLDASNTKLNAELQVINAKINIVFNYYKLKYISGTL